MRKWAISSWIDPTNDLSTCTRRHVSRTPDTTADCGCLSGKFNQGPFFFFLMIDALSVYLHMLLGIEHHPLRPVWLPAADSAGKLPELLRWYTAKRKRGKSAARVPQMTQSRPLWETSASSFTEVWKHEKDHSVWSPELNTSLGFRKEMPLETIFPNYLPITPYPSFHSSHISDSVFDMNVGWRLKSQWRKKLLYGAAQAWPIVIN